jgi:hypothetical protein
METLLTRPVVIALALTGGVLSVCAILLRKREGRTNLARRMDAAGYVFMGISMLLFVLSGFRSQA